MMNVQKVIDELNKGLSLEYASVIQGLQHSFLVQGLFRESIAPMLRDHAEESFKHAKILGDKIVALGGLPTVEPASCRISFFSAALFVLERILTSASA